MQRSTTVSRVFTRKLALPALLMSMCNSYSLQPGQRVFNSGNRGFTSQVLLGSVVAGLALASYSSLNTAECSPAESQKPKDPLSATALYPPLQPFHKGQLKVSPIHTIAYSEYGNPKGKPVLCVHGGPGGGCTPNMARFFDPQSYRIILVDQQGCGDSTPFANLEDNTTYDSVRDFEKIREHLGIEKWQLFGGSWGSTLSLAYAIEHPDRITELVLRGIFLCRKKELEWMYEGKGANYIFPEDWEAYEEAIPPNERDNFMKAYSKRLMGELGEAGKNLSISLLLFLIDIFIEMIKAAKAWSIWEGRISKLHQDPVEAMQSSFADDHFALAFARIENHYFTNQVFFPRDGFLIEKENVAKIAHIPTVIVQGRYDIVCPAISAHDLHKALPSSEIHYVLSGHSAFEKEIVAELVKATEKFKTRKA